MAVVKISYYGHRSSVWALKRLTLANFSCFLLWRAEEEFFFRSRVVKFSAVKLIYRAYQMEFVLKGV